MHIAFCVLLFCETNFRRYRFFRFLNRHWPNIKTDTEVKLFLDEIGSSFVDITFSWKHQTHTRTQFSYIIHALTLDYTFSLLSFLTLFLIEKNVRIYNRDHITVTVTVKKNIRAWVSFRTFEFYSSDSINRGLFKALFVINSFLQNINCAWSLSGCVQRHGGSESHHGRRSETPRFEKGLLL